LFGKVVGIGRSSGIGIIDHLIWKEF
jgi:hypothetical protein